MSGKKIESYDSFRNEIAMLAPDSRITFLVSRDGKTTDIAVTLAERPTEVAQGEQSNKGGQKSQAALGIEVQTLTKDLAERFGYALGEGVIVTRVEPASPAAEVDIQPGDLIQSVNREPVGSAGDFEKAVARTKDNKVLLLIKRGEYSQFIVVGLTK
jgi:serine protease Do